MHIESANNGGHRPITRRRFLQVAAAGTGGLCLANSIGNCEAAANTPLLRSGDVPRSGFDKRSTAEEVTAGLDLSGKTMLITGSTSGIGLETMRVLAMRGAHVLGLARSQEKGERACASVMTAGVKGKATPFVCEQTDYASVAACADAVRKLGVPLDALICNAGLNVPTLEQVNGIEKHFAVQHLSHFILVNRLLRSLQAAPQGRVVMVGSIMYKDAPSAGIEFDNLSGERGEYDWTKMYGQSKLANGLFVRELTRRVSGTAVTANVLHPGNIADTNIGHVWNAENTPKYSPIVRWIGTRFWQLNHGGFFTKSVGQGAATTCYVATAPRLQRISGLYFEDCNVAVPGARMRDDALAAKLWTVSEDLTRPYLPG